MILCVQLVVASGVFLFFSFLLLQFEVLSIEKQPVLRGDIMVHAWFCFVPHLSLQHKNLVAPARTYAM